MARYIKVSQIPRAEELEEILDNEYINFVLCSDCTECTEQGGHANCAGYLFCRRERKLVTETDGCSWGVER